MRVIRTEAYFDALDIEWPFAEQIFGNPGISFALFRCDVESLQFSDLPIYSELENGRVVDTDIVLRFFDVALRNTSLHFASTMLTAHRPYRNEKIAHFLLEMPVVIENSPPEDVPFATLFKNASNVTIGSYVGLEAASGHPLLLFLTVPAGIIVVGAAIAVSKAIDNGLNKSVERATKRLKPKQK